MNPTLKITYTVTDRGEIHKEETREVTAKAATFEAGESALRSYLNRNSGLTRDYTFKIRKMHLSGYAK